MSKSIENYLITRILKVCLFLCMLFSFIASKGARCGGPPPPSNPPDEAVVYCEIDAMNGFKPNVQRFKDELKKANQNRSLGAKDDSLNLDPNPQFLRGDTIPDELLQYLKDHRSIVDTLTSHDERVYICGVRRIVIATIISPHDSSAAGCTDYSTGDTTVHNEGLTAIAVETIIDSCFANEKPYDNHLQWAVAHELGHQFNLPYPFEHCPRSDCMMWFAWSAYGAYKSTFCDSCCSRLGWSHP